MSTAGSTLSPPSGRTRIGAADTPLSILVAAVFAVLVVLLLPGTPHHVHELSLVNTSPYPVRVEARAASGGWLPVGTAEPNATTVVHDTVDLGRTWEFRFSNGTASGGTVTVHRGDLSGAGWEITIPPDVLARLAAVNAGTG